jgi:hypothetical protein
MIQSPHPSIYATTLANQTLSQRPVAGFRTIRKRDEIEPAQKFRQATVVPNPLAIPSFLLNRIGWTWSQIRADLRLIVDSDPEYGRILHGLLAFVETDVVGSAEHPRHGSGILVGLPLVSGWRRRLFVCPGSDQLRWIGD